MYIGALPLVYFYSVAGYGMNAWLRMLWCIYEKIMKKVENPDFCPALYIEQQFPVVALEKMRICYSMGVFNCLTEWALRI